MQLLFEEFFKKVYGVSKGGTNSLMLILTIRLMIYGFIIGAIVFVGYLIYNKLYNVLIILVILIVMGEGAHFIRKSRGRSARKKMPYDATGEHASNMLKVNKSKNKKLLDVSKPKNKSMLEASKSKNGNLLSKNKKLISK